jgi:hypothetical protein
LDAQRYAELIDGHLSTCQFLRNNPHYLSPIQIPDPNILFWQDKIYFRDGLCLTVQEVAIFNNEEMTERSFAYDLREVGTGRLIWRICNHCEQQPVENSCHLHLNPLDEDERLEFFPDSKTTILPYAMHCVKNHFEGKPQEWEVQK